MHCIPEYSNVHSSGQESLAGIISCLDRPVTLQTAHGTSPLDIGDQRSSSPALSYSAPMMKAPDWIPACALGLNSGSRGRHLKSTPPPGLLWRFFAVYPGKMILWVFILIKNNQKIQISIWTDGICAMVYTYNPTYYRI